MEKNPRSEEYKREVLQMLLPRFTAAKNAREVEIL